MKTTLDNIKTALGNAETGYRVTLERILQEARFSMDRFLGKSPSALMPPGAIDSFESNLGNMAVQLGGYAAQIQVLRERKQELEFEIEMDSRDSGRQLIIAAINKHRQACGHEPLTYASETTKDLSHLLRRVERAAAQGNDYFARMTRLGRLTS